MQARQIRVSRWEFGCCSHARAHKTPVHKRWKLRYLSYGSRSKRYLIAVECLVRVFYTGRWHSQRVQFLRRPNPRSLEMETKKGEGEFSSPHLTFAANLKREFANEGEIHHRAPISSGIKFHLFSLFRQFRCVVVSDFETSFLEAKTFLVLVKSI